MKYFLLGIFLFCLPVLGTNPNHSRCPSIISDQAEFLKFRTATIAWLTKQSVPFSEAEEVFQEAVERFLRQISRGKSINQIEGYIQRVAFNYYLDKYVRSPKRTSNAAQHNTERVFSAATSEKPALEDTVRFLREALEELSLESRFIMIWHYFGNYSQPEIAEAFGLSEGGLRGRLERGRKKLREISLRKSSSVPPIAKPKNDLGFFCRILKCDLERLNGALRELPLESRFILMWYYFGNYNSVETAQAFEISESVLKARAEKAVRKLREILRNGDASYGAELAGQ